GSTDELLVRPKLPDALRIARGKRDAQCATAPFLDEPGQRDEEGLNRRAAAEIWRFVRGKLAALEIARLTQHRFGARGFCSTAELADSGCGACAQRTARIQLEAANR